MRAHLAASLVSAPSPPSDLIMRGRDGRPLMVIRPSMPKLALALAKKALGSRDPRALEKVALKVEQAGGRYTFVGYLANGKPRVLDWDGNDLGATESGDSFVTDPQYAPAPR